MSFRMTMRSGFGHVSDDEPVQSLPASPVNPRKRRNARRHGRKASWSESSDSEQENNSSYTFSATNTPGDENPPAPSNHDGPQQSSDGVKKARSATSESSSSGDVMRSKPITIGPRSLKSTGAPPVHTPLSARGDIDRAFFPFDSLGNSPGKQRVRRMHPFHEATVNARQESLRLAAIATNSMLPPSTSPADMPVVLEMADGANSRGAPPVVGWFPNGFTGTELSMGMYYPQNWAKRKQDKAAQKAAEAKAAHKAAHDARKAAECAQKAAQAMRRATSFASKVAEADLKAARASWKAEEGARMAVEAARKAEEAAQKAARAVENATTSASETSLVVLAAQGTHEPVQVQRARSRPALKPHDQRTSSRPSQAVDLEVKRRGQVPMPMNPEAKRRIEEYKREMVAQAALSASEVIRVGVFRDPSTGPGASFIDAMQHIQLPGMLIRGSKPVSPKLVPLSSPGPITPMNLEGGEDGGYLSRGFPALSCARSTGTAKAGTQCAASTMHAGTQTDFLGSFYGPDAARHSEQVDQAIRADEHHRFAAGHMSPIIET